MAKGDVKGKVLRLIEEAGPVGILQAQLQKSLGCSKSYVSELLSRIESAGLIYRQLDAGRSLRVWPAAKLSRPRKGSLTLGFVRSAEYPFLVPLQRNLRRRGINLTFKVYGNGISATRELAEGRIDLALTPLVTQLLFYALGNPLRVLAAGGRGGSGIVASQGFGLALEKAGGLKIATSRMSAMELFLNATLERAGIDADKVRLVYFTDAEAAGRFLAKGKVDAVSIWEPYLSLLTRKGFQRIADYGQIFREAVCCTLAAGPNLERKMLKEVIKAYEASFPSGRFGDEDLRLYAALLNMPKSLIDSTQNSYEFEPSLEPSGINPILKKLASSLQLHRLLEECLWSG